MNVTRCQLGRTAVSLFSFIIWLLPAAAVSAQSSYPTADDLYVNDYANVISSADEAQIRDLLAEYEAGNGVQMTVLTVRSISEYNTGDAIIEQFATNLFNEWGVGQASRNDGVLFLVAVEDRELRIELGSAYGVAFDRRMQRIIDQIIIPYFRQDNYSLGIHEGSRAIVADLRGEIYESLAETRGGTSASAVSPPATSSSESTESTSTAVRFPVLFYRLDEILIGLGIVGTPLGGLLFARYRRNRPRQCNNCQSMMTRLDERADDAYLDKGQITEETIGSVDYDVWVCGSCQNREVIPYKNWLRRYGRCNNCNYRTISNSSKVISSATYTSTGLRENRAYCNHCHHEEITQSVIPRKVRSTSSSSSGSRSSRSSSSFGGGRSSGGGASGKW